MLRRKQKDSNGTFRNVKYNVWDCMKYTLDGINSRIDTEKENITNSNLYSSKWNKGIKRPKYVI